MKDIQTALGPKLRFPEFQSAGNWTTEKLGALATISTEKVGTNICVPMSITSGVGLVSQEDKFGRVIAGDSYKNYLLLKPNDFAYNKSATKEYPEGFLTLYSGTKLAAVPNSIFTCFRINGDSPDVRFLNYQFSDNLHGRWLRQFIQVGARAHGSLSINDNDLMALPVPVPNGTASVSEQQKIAECLSSLDELIAAQTGKVDALKTHKKGLMQQLFPREGETQPRLRISEFREQWIEVKLDDLCSSISSGRDQIDSDGIFDLYGSTSVIGKTKNASFNGERILVARVGANAGFLTRAKGSFGVTDNTLVVSLNPSINIDFLFHYLGNININKLIFGSGQPLITGSILKNLPIHIPIDAEQLRVSACLSSLDELITAQSCELEAFKNQKKGLMQQLFPSPAEGAA